jgi:hypothetical protein
MFLLKRLTYLLVYTVQIFTICFFERIDPDSFHSGLVYAQSIAVNNGLLPNKNFLSPYGAFGPLINGAWLNLVNDSLFSLNLLYGVFIIISGYLVQRNLARYIDWKLALLANSTWVMTLASVIPWPSILANLLMLLAFTILINRKDSIFVNSNSIHYYLFLVITLIDLAILTRVHLAIAPILITISIFIFRKSLNPDFIKKWFLYNIILVLFLSLFMLYNGFLFDWFYQVVIWPATAFETLPITVSYLFSLMWFPFSLILIAILIRLNVLVIGNKTRISLSLAALMNFSLFYVIYYVSTRKYDESQTATFRTLPGFLKNSSENLQFLISFSAGMLVLVGVMHSVIKRSENVPASSKSTNFWERSLMVNLGLTGLAQLYPLHDNVHLWFAAPLMIIPAAYFSKNYLIDSKSVTVSLAIILSSIFAVQGISAHDLFTVDRVRLMSYEQRGLVASNFHFSTVDRTLILLDKYVKGRQLRNNCIQGIFAVSSGNYNSIDGNFTPNIYEKFAESSPSVDLTLKQPKYILECNVTQEEILEMSNSVGQPIFKVPIQNFPDQNLNTFNVLFALR